MFNKRRKRRPPDLGVDGAQKEDKFYDFTEEELAELDDAGDDLFLATPASAPAVAEPYVPGRSDIRDLRAK